jgi:WD40 repeat protein
MSHQNLDLLPDVGVLTKPYPGLRSFEVHESHLFFGREGLSEQLITKLAATRFLVVVGTSGSGKSSLVRAGLLPALYGGFMVSAGSAWRVAIMRPGHDPLGNLAQALNQPEVYGSEAATNRAIQNAVTEAMLRRGSLSLVEVVRLQNMPTTESLLVVADQFEELFRVEPGAQVEDRENDNAAFVKLLLAATTQRAIPIYVVLTMRSDYLGDCAQFWDLPEAINAGQYLIPRLTREQRREAITGPIAVGGAEMTPRLINRLLNDVGDNPDQLPLLQHALMRTWDEWRDKRPAHAAVHEGVALDFCCYEAIGGMEQALSRHADEAFAALPDDRHRVVAEKIFKALTEKGPDNREIRRRVRLGALCAVADATEGEVIAVVEAFRAEGRSFLMPSVGTELTHESLIDISHESLIRGWKGHGNDQKRLKEWVEEEAQSARVYRRLAETAELHQEGKAGLWGDPDLQLALDWEEQNKPNQDWAQRYHPGFEAAIAFLRKSEGKRASDIDTLKRRIAVWRGAFLLIFCLVLLVGWLYLQAEAERENAKKNEKMAQRHSYIANMNLAQKAFEEKHYARANALLNRYLPVTDTPRQQEENWRGFEWYYLWHLSHHELATLKGHTGDGWSVAFSPDNNSLNSKILATSEGQTVKLWDVNEGSEVKELATLTGHTANVWSVAFSPDGRRLATGSYDQTVKLWDVSTRRELATLTGHTANVWSVAFSPDGQRLATGSYDQTVKLWDVSMREALATLSGHQSKVYAVAFSPDGTKLTSASSDKTVKLWDVSEGNEVKELATLNHGEAVYAVAFSKDSGALATGGKDGAVQLWDVKNPQQEPATLGKHLGRVLSLAFSPTDHKKLASVGYDGSVKLWDMDARQELATLSGHADGVLSVAFALDGQTLATGSYDQTVKLWDMGKQWEMHRQDAPGILKGHKNSVWSMAFSPDGQTLATGGSDHTVKLWGVSKGQELATLSGHQDTVLAMAFLRDGRQLASAGGDKTVRLWDINTGKELGKPWQQEDVVWSMALSPNGQTLAIGSRNGTVKLRDVYTQQEWVFPERHQEEKWLEGIRSVAFSPNGKELAAGNEDDLVRLWDVDAKRELAPLSGHGGKVFSLAFSPDGQSLAVGGQNTTVKVWDLATRKARNLLGGHAEYVVSVRYSPDGQRLATGSLDATIRIWDADTLQELVTLRGHANEVYTVAFSSDGKTLASGGKDKTVRLWRAATDAEVVRQRNK